MPFDSASQRSFMRTQHPAIAARWEDLTPTSPRLAGRIKWSQENTFKKLGHQSALQQLGLIKKG